MNFHEFHKNHTKVYQHKDTSKGDVMSQYKYLEKSDQDGGVVVFIPPNPDLQNEPWFYKMINNILEKEYTDTKIK